MSCLHSKKDGPLLAQVLEATAASVYLRRSEVALKEKAAALSDESSKKSKRPLGDGALARVSFECRRVGRMLRLERRWRELLAMK